MASDFAVRRAAFRKLHESACFVIPNPWDVGSAVYLQHLGFHALATTSSGYAFSRGLPDLEWEVGREATLGHIRQIVGATDLPVNADFQSGFGGSPEEVAESVRLCVATGVAGLSIEDSTHDRAHPLHDVPDAVQRVRAARTAIDATGSGVLLTARAECYLTGHADPFHEALRRLMAYAEAGADVLYAPGVRDREQMRAIVAAVAPQPVNILIHADLGLRVSDVAEIGARRISVGSALARAAWTGFIRAAKAIAEEGSFAGFRDLVPGTELNQLFLKESAAGQQ